MVREKTRQQRILNIVRNSAYNSFFIPFLIEVKDNGSLDSESLVFKLDYRNPYPPSLLHTPL